MNLQACGFAKFRASSKVKKYPDFKEKGIHIEAFVVSFCLHTMDDLTVSSPESVPEDSVAVRVAQKRSREETTVESSVIGLLGSGIYGQVYAIRVCESLQPPQNLAMKLMKTIDINEPDALIRSIEYAREVYGLTTSGLFRGFMACPQSGRLGLLMPIFGQRIGNSVLPRYSIPAVSALLRPIAEYLAYSPGMHRDVKPANICLPQSIDEDATLIDFSLCTNMSSSLDSAVITMWYRPMEALVGLEHTKTADIWSFGVVLYNLLTGQHLNRCANEDAKIFYVMDLMDKFGWPKHWPEFYQVFDASKQNRGSPVGTLDFKPLIEYLAKNSTHAEIATDLLKKILKIKPCDRASWTSILSHQFWTLADQSQKPFKPSRPSEPSTKDAENFLATSILINTCHKRTPCRVSMDVVDTLLVFCKRLKFSSSTAYYSMCIWKHAMIGSEPELLSACVFLAASFNEDIRELNLTWSKWVYEIDQSPEYEKKFAKSVIRVLVCTNGFWPKTNWSKMYLDLSKTMMPKLRPGEILFENTALYLFGCAGDPTNELELSEIIDNLKNYLLVSK